LLRRFNRNALEKLMKSLFACWREISAPSLALYVALGGQAAQAADPGYAPPRAFALAAPAYGLDPRCSIIPVPQLNLVGETARFRAQAVCQSRGLYADSLVFPASPLIYRGYSYGRER
jgi:hypothetical protein